MVIGKWNVPARRGRRGEFLWRKKHPDFLKRQLKGNRAFAFCFFGVGWGIRRGTSSSTISAGIDGTSIARSSQPFKRKRPVRAAGVRGEPPGGVVNTGARVRHA